MNNNLSFEAKCDILFKLINKVDYFWNFIHISNGTLLIFLLGTGVSKMEVLYKVLCSVIYCAFMIHNLQAHIRAYGFLEQLVTEIKEEIKNQVFYNLKLSAIINNLSYRMKTVICVLVYTAYTIIILFFIWFKY